MELSIGLPDGLLMSAGDGTALTLYEADHTTVRRRIDCAVLEGARMADIVWSHKLSAVIAAVPERNRLFRWDAYTDSLQEWAGTGEAGRRDGKVAQAKFAATVSITEAGDGTLWLVDRDSSSLRRLEINTDRPDGDPRVTTVVGRHGAGYLDGPAADARLAHPEDLQILYDGSVVVADTGNHALRHVDLTDLEVTTVYGGPEREADELAGEDVVLDTPVRVTVADSQLWVEDRNGRHLVEPRYV
ncbi:NHL repeat-containing protein [Kocuria tytonis]|nr:integrase [Kocuria tytonis]